MYKADLLPKLAMKFFVDSLACTNYKDDVADSADSG